MILELFFCSFFCFLFFLGGSFFQFFSVINVKLMFNYSFPDFCCCFDTFFFFFCFFCLALFPRLVKSLKSDINYGHECQHKGKRKKKDKEEKCPLLERSKKET